MWKLKVLTQFFLAHLPFGEHVNHFLQRINVARNGGKPKELRDRVQRLSFEFKKIAEFRTPKDAVIVEGGTGWDLLPTLMMVAAGASKVFTFDHVRHARFDLALLAARSIKEEADLVAEVLGISASGIRERMDRLLATTSLEELLELASVAYLAPGDVSATGLPDHTVDMCYSHAVLEHVPEQTVTAIAKEAGRILKPDGVFYAFIGLHDHYNSFDRQCSKVNFLKYPDWIWSFWIQNKISYHNRLREKDFVQLFEAASAKIIKVWSETDPADLATLKTMNVSRRFADYSLKELAVTQTEILMRF